jgi:osmotically-inducible protein OsmY
MSVDQLSALRHERIGRVLTRPRLHDVPQQPVGDAVANRALEIDVASALMRSGYAALAGVRCEVKGDRITLFGAVPTYHLKQLAQVFAQRVDGVGKVVNRIAVFP